ncbi:type 3 dihydrofolate reductase [Vibrio sp. SM6]|uniref:Dihydrofolate reductase n=1 Tax=Vibrio agarilyticus TaxID=2726741 RepID=A0A7X8YGH0_9VIBR|nr:type 3 dihydrofolate reductase [Vibrio agarilyticus]NLS12382.1 type 3 dihydrofolate reductase [Vibrio agarilyticus]
MIISMIAAMAHDRVIGLDNQMPWHLPADFAWFKQCTMSKPVIMGRKTYDSIGRALPGRHNIVISRDPERHIDGVTVVTSIEAALIAAGTVDEVMVIGGGAIYQACLPLAKRLYLTFIDANIGGDTQFPQWDEHFEQTFESCYSADEKNAYNMRFTIWNKE